MRIFRHDKRLKEGGLAKYVYLTNKQLIYQLVTSPGNGNLEVWLDTFYKQLENLRPERNFSAAAYLVVFAALLLTKFNLIDSIDAAGFSVKTVAFQHILLVAFALSQFRFSYVLSKCSYICGIFERKFYLSQPPERALLLARYPFAYDVSKYYVTQIGCLSHTASMRIPFQLITALLFLLCGLLVYVVFSFWLFIGVSVEIWLSQSALPVFWSRATVIIANCIAISTYLLPTTGFLKRSYMHIGLIKMMNRAHETDRDRYIRYLDWINRIRGK